MGKLSDQLKTTNIDQLEVGYHNIQNIAASAEPASPAEESAYWYQYYFHSERGRNGLTDNRAGIAKLLYSSGRAPGILQSKPFSNL